MNFNLVVLYVLIFIACVNGLNPKPNNYETKVKILKAGRKLELNKRNY